MANMEPNKIVNDAPNVELYWVPRYRKRGQAEGGAETTPVAMLRPVVALDADHLHERGRADAERQVAPELVEADQEGPGTPAVAMSARECPATTAARHGEHADDGGGDGDHGPDGQGDVHRPAAEEAGLEDVPEQVTDDDLTRWRLGRGLGGVDAFGRGDHQDPPVHPYHVDVLAVQPRQDLGLDDLVGTADRYLACGHVDDPVHHRHQLVHVVRREQHGDPLGPGEPGQHRDDPLLTRDVQVGQRLVEHSSLAG